MPRIFLHSPRPGRKPVRTEVNVPPSRRQSATGREPANTAANMGGTKSSFLVTPVPACKPGPEAPKGGQGIASAPCPLFALPRLTAGHHISAQSLGLRRKAEGAHENHLPPRDVPPGLPQHWKTSESRAAPSTWEAPRACHRSSAPARPHEPGPRPCRGLWCP